MHRQIPLPWKLAVLGTVAFLLLPWTRGPLLAAAVLALAVEEVVRRRRARGRRISLLIDGQLRRLPPEGGSVPFGSQEVSVRREGDRVVVDGEPLEVGAVVFRGSSLMEVVS
jgi:hypothetical protein